jgi:hypothetical protein
VCQALEARAMLAGISVVDEIPPTRPTVMLLPLAEPPYEWRVGNGGAGPYRFTLAFRDDEPMDESSVRDNPLAVRVVGPNGYDVAARLLETARVAEPNWTELYHFEMPPPGGRWDPGDDGPYTVRVGERQIKDADGNFVPGGDVGTIAAWIPAHGPDVRASGALRAAGIVRAGRRTAVRLTLSNLGDDRIRGDVRLRVGLVSAAAPPGTIPQFPIYKDRFLFRTTLRAGKSKRYTLRLGLPADTAPGEYRLVAWAECLDEIETDAFNNASDGPTVVVRGSGPRS